jgi:hypothetical protein
MKGMYPSGRMKLKPYIENGNENVFTKLCVAHFDQINIIG